MLYTDLVRNLTGRADWLCDKDRIKTKSYQTK